MTASGKRGAALVAAIILLGMTSMAVGAAVIATGDDARTSALRADSLRAFYAAESAVEVAIRALNDTPDNPFTGPLTLPSGARALAVEPFDPEAASLEATLAGAAGRAERRIHVAAQ